MSGSGSGTIATGATYVTLEELKEYLGTRNSDTFAASAGADTLTVTKTYIEWLTGMPVVVSTTDTLPAGLTANIIYYVVASVEMAFKLATTKANAMAGTTINITDTGTGTHTVTKALTDDDLLQDSIDDAVGYIEDLVGKSFLPTTATRYYQQDSVCGRVLSLDEDLLTVTTLTEGDESGTVISASDYWLLPRNEGPPYHRIELKADSDYSWDWTTDGEISVAGTWGFSTTAPKDVRRAALVLAAYFYRQKDNQNFDTVSIPGEGVRITPVGIPRTTMMIIRKYQNPLG